ncbi:sugar phosphate isomerase/epimerase family protein [Antarctobacter sp.]|uniref:sugar phosphate isomerase/epimerase family protein n=1 Tax=Antarctobacter sp. TaxID=1872577 RepID=UPI003A8D5B3B
MRPDSPIEEPGGDWRALIHALSADRARVLAGRARSAPLFAHAYAFHLNLRFGGMTPADLLDFAQAQRLDGVKIHVEDGEDASLRAMTETARHNFGTAAAVRGLALHVETSSTDRPALEEAVTIAMSTNARSVRCYPRYEGRISEIIARTTEDLRLLDNLDPDGRLCFTLEQHEDLTSDELVGIVEQVGNPRLTLLFDFGNMINAYERPLAALARQAAHVTEVHVKDCCVVPDRGGWGHRACISGQGHLPMHALLAELLLLGDTRPQVTSYGLEEEDGYFAPALRCPTDDPDPFIAARSQSYTDPGAVDLGLRLKQEAAAAQTQVETVRAMLHDIAAEAEHRSTSI